ncbi:MAG: hypothetical protein ABIG30_02650 [Candidatus Aenigmatarchaeota archaeon]
MRKSSSSRRKGQWFLIAAVVISGVFLTISTTYSSYLGIDASRLAGADEAFIYKNLNEQLLAAARSSVQQDDDGNEICPDLETNLENFRSFAEKKYSELGYYVEITYEKSGCAIQDYNIAVESDKMSISKS